MALEALTTSITASATVSAGLAENLTLYVTQESVEVLYESSDPVELLVTQEGVEVLYLTDIPADLYVTQVSVEVLYLTPEWIAAAITASATVVADLTVITGETWQLISDITTSGLVTANLTSEVDLAADISASAQCTANILRTVGLSTSITTSSLVTANLTGFTQDLTASITASAVASANLNVTYAIGANIYAAGHLFAEWPVYKIHFKANVATSAVMTADMVTPKLSGSILATGSLYGKLTGKQHLAVDVTANALITADIDAKPQLSSAITASATVVADLRENTEYLTAAISASGTVTAILNAPWHAGNTLTIADLTQSVDVEFINVEAVENTLSLTQEAVAIYGINNLATSNTITFTQTASVLRTLSTKTASSTLSLTDSAVAARRAQSYLILNQVVSSEIYFLTGSASGTLNLTDSVSLAGSIYVKSASSSLELTQTIDLDIVTATDGTSELDFAQFAYGVVLATKKYVVFQAPFEFIQASMVTPSPLMGDTENLISNLVLRRSMAGTRRTYVKSSSNRRLKYTFSVDRPKGLEMEAFFNAYNGSHIKMLNWKGEVWKVKLINNPLDYVQTRRAEPNGDRTEVNIELEGVKIHG